MRLNDRAERNLPFLGDRLEDFDGLFQQGSEVAGLKIRAPPAILEVGNSQKGGDGGQGLIDVANAVIDHSSHRGIVASGIIGTFKAGAQGGERCAQIMGDVFTRVAQRRHAFLKPGKNAVEDSAEPIQLVPLDIGRQAKR